LGRHNALLGCCHGCAQGRDAGQKFHLFEGRCDEQTAGKYVVTKQGDLLLAHLTDTAIASKDANTAITSANEKAEQDKKPVAFFARPRQSRHLSALATRLRWAAKTARCCTCERRSCLTHNFEFHTRFVSFFLTIYFAPAATFLLDTLF